MCYHCLTRLLFRDHLSDVKGQCFGQRCSVKGSLSYYKGGYPQVSVAVGQKVVPSPAVSSAMCRMWVIFKESRVLDFNTKRQPLPRWAAVLIGGESCGKAWPRERPSAVSNSKHLRLFYYIFFASVKNMCVEKQKPSLRCSTPILPVLTGKVSESNLSVLLFLLSFYTIKETVFFFGSQHTLLYNQLFFLITSFLSACCPAPINQSRVK